VIVSFDCQDTQALFETQQSKRFSSISRTAARKLITLQAAGKLSDLAVPPGNRLEPLTGRRKGFHSIRINDQWRIVFRWTDKGPANVAIVDYH
jgi:toxin HigB-1